MSLENGLCLTIAPKKMLIAIADSLASFKEKCGAFVLSETPCNSTSKMIFGFVI